MNGQLANNDVVDERLDEVTLVLHMIADRDLVIIGPNDVHRPGWMQTTERDCHLWWVSGQAGIWRFAISEDGLRLGEREYRDTIGYLKAHGSQVRAALRWNTGALLRLRRGSYSLKRWIDTS